MSECFQKNKSDISPFRAGLKAACPRCGNGNLYKSILVPADNCSCCNLDYSFIDSGDGPAVIVIFVLGLLIMVMATTIESVFGPPLWVHALLWTPIVVFACIWSLRFAKALMIALQYNSGAHPEVKIRKMDQ